MAELERTAEAALQILLALRTQEVQALDQAAQTMISQELVTQILRLAWKHQFDEDRQPVTLTVRALVLDAIEEERLGEAR